MAFMDRFRRNRGQQDEEQRPPMMRIPDIGRRGAAERGMVPREQQGWGEQPPPAEQPPWDNQLTDVEDEANLERMARPRTAEEEDARRMGEQMGARRLAEMAGRTPFDRDSLRTARQMDAQKKTSSVTVDDEGRVYLGDRIVDYDGLARELEARVAENPELKLVVRGDVETKFGGVAEVMRIAERAGVRSMAVATKDEGGGD